MSMQPETSRGPSDMCDQPREGSGGGAGGPRGAEGADRKPTDRPLGLRLAAGALVCVLVAGAFVATKNIMTAAQPSRASAARQAPIAGASTDSELEAAVKLNQKGRFGEAAALLERVVERNATDQSARVAYAQALVGQQKHKAAHEQYEAAIALLDPSVGAPSPGASRASGLTRDPAAAQLHFEAGTCASMAELAARALEHYSMAQTLDPAEPKYPLYLAMAQIKSGDEAAANVSLLRAVKLRPELAEAWGTMAELALRQNRLGLAEQHVAEARWLQPDTIKWRVVEARVHNRKNEPEKGAALLAGLRPDQRRDRSVMAVLSESYGLMGKPAEAAAMYVKAASAAPKDAQLNYDAAVWLERAGEMTKAANFARTAAVEGHAEAKDLLERLKGYTSVPRD